MPERRPKAAPPTIPPPSPPPTAPPSRGRPLAFGILTVACLLIAVGYVAWASGRSRPASPSPQTTRPIASPADVAASSPENPTAGATPGSGTIPPTAALPPRVVFQNVTRDEGYAQVAVADVADPSGPRTISSLTCERVYFAAGQGLCLGSEFGLITTFHAVIFDADFQPRSRVELFGPPSRARISADGRYGAATVFLFGHSYADANFSTMTSIIDMAAGTSVGQLEEFTVERDGAVIRAPDFNFWGVTFAQDSDHFYATLRTGGQTYLVDGSVAARHMRVLAENVECPSLSPDGTRIAFKKLVAEGPTWRLHVLDLATMVETPLSEDRSVDDQAEWLDAGHLLYAIGEDIWQVPSDGTGSPSLFIAHGLSPAVVR